MNKKIYVVFEEYYHEGALGMEQTIGVFDEVNIAKNYIEEKSNEDILNELIQLRKAYKEKNWMIINIPYKLEKMQEIKYKWQDFDNINFYKPFIMDKIYVNFRVYKIIPYELNRKYNREELYKGIWSVE